MDETIIPEIPNEDLVLEAEYFDPEVQEELDWKEKTGLTEDSLCSAIEAIIFMSERPISLNKLKKYIDETIPLRIVHESIGRLQEEYEQKQHGIRLQEVAEGYQFRTKANNARFIQNLFSVNSLVLSPTALEVLAIIAYKQPISRIEVDKIRGVESSHIVRALMDKRLVKVAGRGEEVGRPVVYATTPDFLEIFNLKDLGELPPEYELESMLEKNELGKISDIKEIVTRSEKDKFYFDEIDEIDQLKEQIKNISTDTAFIKSLTNRDKLEGKLSAFDLLEQFVEDSHIKDQNKEAALSEPITTSADPQIINDLSAGPFNVPEVMEDDYFIDEDEEVNFSEEEEFEEEFKEESEELLYEEKEALDEAQLEEALDKAFDKLMGEDIDFDDQGLQEREEAISEKTSQMLENAQNLDIDLSFLSVEDFSKEASSKE